MLFGHATPDPKSKVKQMWDSDAIDKSNSAATMYLLEPYRPELKPVWILEVRRI